MVCLLKQLDDTNLILLRRNDQLEIMSNQNILVRQKPSDEDDNEHNHQLTTKLLSSPLPIEDRIEQSEQGQNNKTQIAIDCSNMTRNKTNAPSNSIYNKRESALIRIRRTSKTGNGNRKIIINHEDAANCLNGVQMMSFKSNNKHFSINTVLIAMIFLSSSVLINSDASESVLEIIEQTNTASTGQKHLNSTTALDGQKTRQATGSDDGLKAATIQAKIFSPHGSLELEIGKSRPTRTAGESISISGQVARASQIDNAHHYAPMPLTSGGGEWPFGEQRGFHAANMNNNNNYVKMSGFKSNLISELRLSSGSKSEPPSRPQVEWSKQKPHFGMDLARNVSVELGKSAYLTCRVFDRGDKTVSWLRPRENEILTVGRYTYVGDPRFTSINEQNNNDWILEIKDVTLNDSTSYECQVSTDPKMSLVYNLQVKAAKARIKQGEQYSCTVGTSIEFTCDSIGLGVTQQNNNPIQMQQQNQQTYWYFNGNLLNYHANGPNSNLPANLNYEQQQHQQHQPQGQFNQPRNFTIERDFVSQTSRFKLFNVQLSDSGNYTCKPTSAEPATIRLTVKKPNRNHNRSGGYYTANGQPQPVYHKEWSKGRRFESSGPESQNSNSANSSSHTNSSWLLILSVLSITTSVLITRLNLLQQFEINTLVESKIT